MIIRINITILFFALFLNYAFPQSNFRIYPSTITQTEPVIFVNSLNPLIIFASARTINGAFNNEGIYVSTNGGVNWRGTDTCRGEYINNHGGDPSVVIDKFGNFVITHIGNTTISPGVYSHFSTDMGLKWSNSSTITTQQPEDKGTTSVDYFLPSPYFGNIYATWVNLNSPPFPIQISISSNSGQNWTSALTVNPGNQNKCSGGSVKSRYDGKVYLTWAGLSGTSPFIENFVGFATSTNGGNTWNFSQNIFKMNGIAGFLSNKGNIRVNGLPQLEIDNSNSQRRGWLYIVTTEKNLLPAGSDPDIIFHRSTDGGTTWSAGIRVNQDPINNGKTQYFPAMCVDSLGGIDIIFYDDRNTSSDSSQIYLARSKDGGNTWYEKVISDHNFKPKSIFGAASGYQGDHITITSVNNKIYALWMDDYSGLYQVWASIIDLNTIGINNISNIIPDKFELFQNYPNPFNPNTNIKFQIQSQNMSSQHNLSGDLVSLKVYDVLGKEIATLVNENLKPGTYEVKFSNNKISSGIYFYRMTVGSYFQIRKMIFMK
jgi:hypothetical protein